MAAIRTDPDAALPRLVYADWLDDRGQADRAEFIRIQCALEGRDLNDGLRRDLVRRRDAIFYPNRRGWTERLWQLGARDIEFGGGFPNAFAMDAGRFVHEADRVLAETPAARLRLTGITDRSAAALAGCRALGHVNGLSLAAGHLSAHGLAALGTSPHVSRLTRLSVRGCRVDASAAGTLARTPLFGRLHALDLSDNPLGDEGAGAVGRADPGPHTVDLSATGLSHAALAPIADGPLAGPLRALLLADNRLGGGAIGLGRLGPPLAALHTLDVRRTGISGRAVRDLFRSPRLPALTDLRYDGNPIGPFGGAVVAEEWNALRAGRSDPAAANPGRGWTGLPPRGLY